ncbi:MAG: hypothetical protein Q9169_003489 [Polycauliona sp. 2 TL-2023]
MALHVHNTRPTHPHLTQAFNSRASLLHQKEPCIELKASTVHVATRDSAYIHSTIDHLLSRLPGHRTTRTAVRSRAVDTTKVNPTAVRTSTIDTVSAGPTTTGSITSGIPTVDPTTLKTPGGLTSLIDMQGRQAQSSRAGRDCLPAIAPSKRKRSPSLDSTRHSSSSTKSTPSLPRTRLPPRSRFGCWTCRTRKVKCDEARPKCSPCTRLGHRCDYNPRLSFKDDTPRVVEKMQHLTGQSQGVWDQLLSRLYDSQLASHPRPDLLPPFSSLTNDADREKKAECRPPGSYNVIVTPSSIAQLDEYKASQDVERTPPSAVSRSPEAGSADPSSPDPENNVIILDDPDTVMLRVFEDSSKKLTLPLSPSSRFGVSSPSSLANQSTGHYWQQTDSSILSSHLTPPTSTFEITPQDRRDWPLICHYRNLLSRHLFHVHRGSITPQLAPGAFFTQELFERTVATFPPLYHALMALCALGIAHRSDIQNLDSLQHYQQALPCLQKTLRSPEDLSSDGALLTHFVLLLYEIAAAAPRASNLWSQHVNQLLRIFVLRSEMYETEPYSFLLWWVCNIDTHALICGTGNGELVETILQYNMWPTADNVVQLHGSGGCYNPSTEEAHAMPAVLEFNRKVEILTCRMALLRRNLGRAGAQMSKPDSTERQRKVMEIQQTLRLIRLVPRLYYLLPHFNVPLATYFSPVTSLPSSDFAPLSPQPSFSNWPQGKHSPTPPTNTQHEISISSSEILTLTRNIIASGHHELRFAVLPLFMAGLVLPRDERGQALRLMEGMEMESIGRNTRATRELLEAVYAVQDEQSWGRQYQQHPIGEGGGGGGGDVDWIRMLGERGLQLI